MVGLIIIGVLVVAMLVIVALAKFMPSKDDGLARKKAKKGRQISIWERVYEILKLIPWVSSIQAIFDRLYLGAGVRLEDIKKTSGRITFMLLLVSCIFPVFGIIFASTWVIFATYMMGGVFMFKIMTTKYQTGIYRQDLFDLQELVDVLKSGYSQEKTVIGALLFASSSAGLKHSTTAERLADILTDIDADILLEEYYIKAPNKYLKQLAGLCMKIMEIGDIEEGPHNSVFMSGLNDIVEDIRMEYHFLEKLHTEMNGSSTNLILAFSLVQACVWALPFFNVMGDRQDFLSTPIGLLASILAFIGLFYLCFEFIGTVSITTESNIAITEKMVLSNLAEKKFVREMLHRIAPVHQRNKRSVKIVETTEPLLRKASSNLTIQEFYLQRILTCAVAILLIFTLLQGYHVINKRYILGANWKDMVTQTNEDYMRKSKKEFEYNTLRRIEDEHMTEAEMLAYIGKEAEYKPFLTQSVEDYAESLAKKYKSYENSSTRWYDFLIAFACGWLGWIAPNRMLTRKARNREWEIQNEVEGFTTVLMVMTKMPSTQVLEVLIWMERYAVIFKKDLSDAIHSYTQSPYEALAELEEKTRNVTMKNIITKLENSISSMSLKSAFGAIESNRVFMRENRKIDQDKVLKSKTFSIKQVGDRATFVVLFLYLLVPIGVQILPMLAPIKKVFTGGIG